MFCVRSKSFCRDGFFELQNDPAPKIPVCNQIVHQRWCQESSWKNKIEIMKAEHQRQIEGIKTRAERHRNNTTYQKDQSEETKEGQTEKGYRKEESRQKKAKPEDKHNIEKDHNQPERPKKKAEHYIRTAGISAEVKEKGSERSRQRIEEEDSEDDPTLLLLTESELKEEHSVREAPTSGENDEQRDEEEKEVHDTEKLVEQSQENTQEYSVSIWIAAMIIAAMSIVGILHGIGDLNEKVVDSISNATTVISAGISGISQLPDSIVGAFGILLYILVFGLQARVIYSRYCTRNSGDMETRHSLYGRPRLKRPPANGPKPY